MRFRRALRPMTRVDLIPMIDVVFQLVVFFMVSTTFTLTPGINLALPTSRTAEPVVMTRLVVSVRSAREIYINDRPVALDELAGELAAIPAKQRSGIASVVLEADRSVSYALMVQVLDSLREAGFRGVSLRLHEEPGSGSEERRR